MTIPCDQIKILSASCQGIRNESKRSDLWSYLSQKKPNIVCLQDTHLISKDQNNLTSLAKCEYLVNGLKTNPIGVIILLYNNFEYTLLYSLNILLNHGSVINGNLLYVDINTGALTLRMITIYAPNVDTPSFFQSINTLTEENTMEHLVLCGDFNLVLNPDVDCSNYVNINNPKSQSVRMETINVYNLKDAF